MQSIQQPSIKYRKDYSPSNYLIDEIQLKIEIYEEYTQVSSTLQIRVNPEVKSPSNTLILNGESQVLKSLKLNEKLLTDDQYKCDEETLTIFQVPKQFTLQVESTIKPQENTKLMGLYKSNNLFCTQCEPEGFRRITYFIDRPDVLAYYTTTIAADKKSFPILLSNGNLIDQGDLPDNRHWVTWKDPFKKPCYLFAMIAGDLEVLEDHFITGSGKDVILRIFSEKGYKEKCRFAMESLKKAFKWDEEQYGREYDLDIFMIAVISDFNAGAMENKGLNIFNTKCVIADPHTATDADYQRLEGVIAHEYFHNWTGNRVTCRDWFQLSLKEGLTVFRDHTFSEDMGSPGVARINDVEYLRTVQFLEDSGPLAHPVRPDSYIEMNNFYTATVYDKGSEVIRMMRTILGKSSFRKGMDLYFERHDGQAVTCDDFAQAMQDVSNIDLTQFKLWYSQSGTPELHITTEYNELKKEYHMTIEQSCLPTPNQPEKLPMHIPLAIALLDQNGKEMPLNLARQKENKNTSLVLNITEHKHTFIFTNVLNHPIPSLLRDFSAPVKLYYDYSDSELAFLMAHDQNDFSRREAMVIYTRRIMLSLIQDFQNNRSLSLSDEFISTFRKILLDKTADKALIAYMLTLPSETYLGQFMDTIDVDALYTVREFIKTTLAEKLENDFKKIYNDNLIETPYQYNVTDAAKRSLKNTCLNYLIYINNDEPKRIAKKQFEATDNMTDQFAALSVLAKTDCPQRLTILDTFYKTWQHEPLIIDKWFAVQAISNLPNTLQNVSKLLEHPDFNIKNPNRVYALLVSFSRNNFVRFHDITGKGYTLLTDQILKLDPINPHVAARLARAFTLWRKFDDKRKNLMRLQLERLLNQPDLSKDVYEIVSKSLKE